jgi:hypothetical protein
MRMNVWRSERDVAWQALRLPANRRGCPTLFDDAIRDNSGKNLAIANCDLLGSLA